MNRADAFDNSLTVFCTFKEETVHAVASARVKRGSKADVKKVYKQILQWTKKSRLDG